MLMQARCLICHKRVSNQASARVGGGGAGKGPPIVPVVDHATNTVQIICIML
jgi:hypothetical protein